MVVGPVVRITVGAPGTAFAIANGDALRTHASVSDPLENLGSIPAMDLSNLVDPSRLFPPQLGSDNHAIQFTISVDPDHPGSGEGTELELEQRLVRLL